MVIVCLSVLQFHLKYCIRCIIVTFGEADNLLFSLHPCLYLWRRATGSDQNIWLQLQAAQTSILQRVSGLTLQSQGIGPVTWLPPVWCLCRTSFVLVLFCLFFSSAYISRELNIVSFYMTCWKRWTEAVLMDISLLRLFKPVQYKKTQGQIQALLDKLSLSCLGIQHVVMYCYWDSSNCGQNLISVHDYSDADLS